MGKIKRNWELLSEEKKKETIQGLIDFFENERGETIGMIAASNLLDYFLQTIGIYLYNQGIDKSINFVKDSLENLQLDLEVLKK